MARHVLGQGHAERAIHAGSVREGGGEVLQAADRAAQVGRGVIAGEVLRSGLREGPVEALAAGEAVAVGVEVQGVALAGERHGGGAAVHPGIREHVDAVGGGGARLADRDGIAVRHRAVEGRIEGDPAVVVEPDLDAAALGADDRAEAAAADAVDAAGGGGVEVDDGAAPAGVAQEDDAVAAREPDATGADPGTELAGGKALGTDGRVELRRLGAVRGEDAPGAAGGRGAATRAGRRPSRRRWGMPASSRSRTERASRRPAPSEQERSRPARVWEGTPVALSSAAAAWSVSAAPRTS